MADVAVKNDIPIVDKDADQVEEAKKVEVVDKTENGVATEIVKETNGESAPEGTKTVEGEAEEVAEKSGESVEVADPSNDTDEIIESSNGDKLENEEEIDETSKNGDSTDSIPAEAVKRKVVSDESKTDESSATPEKKAKLDESKEEVTNGSEANEVAA